ncbi:hypothetical protein [Alkaliphilus sp. B6464]|uniref:hypothetical protein n=1 Tax=Alkaliphilus sp. B6464 TaxID=2731219 RepID=UPI002012042A|nr:hypothetical protein [Alkaliphilus sp. B6464]
MKANLSKILFGIGTVLLICFLGGLVYITYDYNTNTAYTYGSTPLYVYYYIHGFIFLLPSILCFIVSLVLKLKSKIKA